MDELAARAVLVPASDLGDGLATSISRSEIEEVVGQDDRAFPRATPVAAPATGTTSDPGFS